MRRKDASLMLKISCRAMRPRTIQVHAIGEGPRLMIFLVFGSSETSHDECLDVTSLLMCCSLVCLHLCEIMSTS